MISPVLITYFILIVTVCSFLIYGYMRMKSLSKPNFISEEDYEFYLLGYVLYPMAFLAHVMLAGLFWLLNQPIMILFNLLISLPVFGLGGYLHIRKGKLTSPYILFCLEICGHAVLSTVLMGWEYGWHYNILLSILFPMMCSKLSRWQKIFLVVFPLLSYGLLAVLHTFNIIVNILPNSNQIKYVFISNASSAGFFLTLMLMQYFRASSLAESRSNSLQQQLVAKEREEKESLQQELDEANRMQSALLPLRSPKISWLDMAGASIPASEVGGDFFDYLIDEQKPKIAIADVSGKGLKAAMNAVMASGILNLSAQYQTVPSSIMSDMNNTLSQTMEQDMNGTMVLAQFDIQKKKMILANAGQHAYPLLKRGSSVEPIKAKGLALGMIPSITYKPITVDLQLGDLLLFMTDGITEPRNAEGLMYEESGRFHQVLSALPDELNAEGVVENIIQDVIDHMVDEEERDDDITLVAVKVT